MPNKTSEELKDQLYQERFDRLDEKLDDIKDMLVGKASAGSVFRLEQRVSAIEQSHIPCASVVLVQREVSEMKAAIVRKEEFETLRKELEPIKQATDSAVYFYKHPGQLKAVIVGAVVIFLITSVSTVASGLLVRKMAKEVRVEMTQKAK